TPISPESFMRQVQGFLPANKRKQPARPELAEHWQTPSRPAVTAIVLVVDDSEVNLNLMCTLLRPVGYEVLTARDVEQGLSLALARRPQLIVTDVHLAHESGYEFTARLKQHPELRDIPCVVISSTNSSPGAAAEALAAGAEMYILRPIEPQQLLDELALCLAKAKT